MRVLEQEAVACVRIDDELGILKCARPAGMSSQSGQGCRLLPLVFVLVMRIVDHVASLAVGAPGQRGGKYLKHYLFPIPRYCRDG